MMCRDPQAVYDMNIMAIKLAEDPEVRLACYGCFRWLFHLSPKTSCANLCTS